MGEIISMTIKVISIIFIISIFYYMFLFAPIELVRAWLFPGVDIRIFYLVFIPILIIIFLIYAFRDRYEKCSHGIVGGNTINRCKKCLDEKESQLREAEVRIRIAEVRRKSEELRRTEIDRLRKSFYKRLDYLYSLSPRKFEDLVMEMFMSLGYKVKQTPYSNDRGKDGIAYKNNNKYLIECKRYETSKRIGRPMLQKFFAAMHEEKAVKGFFVTTAQFAETAYEYAKINNIELIDGERLIDGMNKAFPRQKNDEYVQVMCLECGDIVSFNLSSEISKGTCINGHTVNNDMTYDKLAQEVKIYM